ncbi:MAG: DUF3794 domain-containing protein [Lachnospiraceae bacterium]|nr:DUF3794 domain-containing protein [Lachnospiraceae bacterium]
MELVRKNIHMSRQKARALWQMTWNDDYNVPDSMADVQQLILHQGTIEMGECSAQKDRATLRGSLNVSVLYGDGSEEHLPGSLMCKLPFQEQVHMEGLQEGESLQVKWNLEDISVSLVHSRKLSIKALVTFVVTAEELVDEEMAVEVSGGADVETRMCQMSVAGLAACKRDTCRIKDEVILPMNQPNIRKILWQEMAVRGLDVRLGEGQILLKGELQVFVLYLGEEEPAKTWWLSQNIPFNSRVECPGCQEQMIGHVEANLLHGDVEVKPDYDGELRVLNVDAILDVNMKVYAEEHLSMLCDLYSPSRELKIQTRPARCEKLLVSNASRCRAMDRLPIAQKDGQILQICNASGDVKIDEVTITDQGLKIEGVVFVRVLYVTADDRQPFRSLRGMLPFEHVLEVPGMGQNPIYHLHASLEQLHAAMVSGEEVEVKAAILINGLVLEPLELTHIESVEEAPLDLEKVKSLPGMLIYVVQPGDSLWEIAKTYHTTMEQVRALNELGQQEVKAGQRLLLMKQMGSL